MSWQPIETAPKDETRMLLSRYTDGNWNVWLGKNDGECWYGDGCWEIEPSHWTPLPEPPLTPPATGDDPIVVKGPEKE